MIKLLPKFFVLLTACLLLLLVLSGCKVSPVKAKAGLEAYLQKEENIRTFSSLLEAAGGLEMLFEDDIKSFSLFIPNDTAWELLGRGVIDNLQKAENQQRLQEVLKSHVSNLSISERKVKKRDLIPSMANQPLNLTLNQAEIIQSVKLSGGYAHIIDRVLQR